MSAISRLTHALADRYLIQHELGAGGMATVYVAHDLRHDRDVAIKVLSSDLGATLGTERFLSEIRTTARLQHPHILALLDSGEADGQLYYVMPLVIGETLRERLDREKQLPIDDAVLITTEVADALGYAHSTGLIHRDIKPENILLQHGHVLVADFGIALALQRAGGQRMTQTGVSLGTPQYMSPEQAMGERTLDGRSDLYSLGTVAYEMLIGEPPFSGATAQAIVARIVSEEPRSLCVQRKTISAGVERAVLRALEKLPADRWSTAGELSGALRADVSTGVLHRRPGSRPATFRDRLPWRARLSDPILITMTVLALATGIVAIRRAGGAPSGAVAPDVRFSIPTLAAGNVANLGLSNLAISNDGRALVYVARGENRRQVLKLRLIDDTHERTLIGTEDADQPLFSPDGKAVIFFKDKSLFKVALDGSAPRRMIAMPGQPNGASWAPLGPLVVSSTTALWAMSESGQSPRAFSKPDRARGELFQDNPLVLDDGKTVVYSSWTSNLPTSAKLAMVSLTGGTPTALGIAGTHPLAVVDGVLVYASAGGTLMAVPFDVGARRVKGPPVQLASDVAVNNGSGLARAAVSRNGTLFYQSGVQLSHIMQVDFQGNATPLIDEAASYQFPRLSPDGRRLAVTVASTDRSDVWLLDLLSKTPIRLTNGNAVNERPEWSPDGTRVLYRTNRGTGSYLAWRRIDLSEPAEPLLANDREDAFEGVMSPDGHRIAFQLDTSGPDVYYRDVGVIGSAKPISASNFIEDMPRISPDGRWIAFVTDESGVTQVVVQPFPGPGARTQVSTSGGTEPVWSPDGKRLFYRAGGRFVVADVQGLGAFAVVSRTSLFIDDYLNALNPHANYDVARDGRHLILLKPASAGDLQVAVNWGATVAQRTLAAKPP